MKPLDQRTDGDWARVLAANQKRARRRLRNRLLLAEAKVRAGGLLSLEDVANMELIGVKR